MVQDSTSPTGYLATTTLETYYDKKARTEGKAPMQIEDLQLPVDPSGVYAIIFGGLKQKFTNCTDVLDLDPDTTTKTEDKANATTNTTPAADTPAATPTSAEAQPTSGTADTTPAPTA